MYLGEHITSSQNCTLGMEKIRGDLANWKSSHVNYITRMSVLSSLWTPLRMSSFNYIFYYAV